MKKILSSLIVALIFTLILIFASLCYFSQALAIQTQVNKITDLFDRNIENKDELLRDLQQQNDNAINQIKSGSHHDSIEGINGAEGKVRELSSTPEKDLDNAGRSKRVSTEYQFYDENELEPDYSKPGNIMHKLDGEDIVKATEETMRKIGIDVLERLKVIGFNCKTVKGPIEKDLTYFIQIEKEEQKNTEYDQKFCEEPRSHYNCQDIAILRCAKPGIEWGAWQDKQISVPGGELVNCGKTIFWADHTGDKCFEYKLPGDRYKTKFGRPVTQSPHLTYGMREFLATKHQGATIENIGTEIASLCVGGIFSIDGWSYCGRVLGSKDYAWHTYTINYKYRASKPICVQWQETWSETCILK